MTISTNEDTKPNCVVSSDTQTEAITYDNYCRQEEWSQKEPDDRINLHDCIMDPFSQFGEEEDDEVMIVEEMAC